MHDRPDYPGGPIVNYLRLLPALVNRGYQVHLMAIYFGDFPNARVLEQSGVHIYATPQNYTESLVKWILENIEQIQPDVFIPDVSTPGCFAGKLLLEYGVPVITTHRSDDETNWGRAIYFSDPQYRHELSGIICVSTFLKNALHLKVPTTSTLTTVIPSGVDIPEIAAPMEDGDIIRIVYAGRLVAHQKRIKETVNAFIKLCILHENIEISIVGDGPEKSACEQMVQESGFSDRFSFTGRLTGSAYKLELLQHHIIVLLSDFEGTPGALLDGMSCGLIPIAKRYPGIEELIKDQENGLLVEDRESSFEQAIDLLVNNIPLRKKLSVNARKTIIQGYSIDSAVEKWIAFINLNKNQAEPSKKFLFNGQIELPEKNELLIEDIRDPRDDENKKIKLYNSFYASLREHFANFITRLRGTPSKN